MKLKDQGDYKGLRDKDDFKGKRIFKKYWGDKGDSRGIKEKRRLRKKKMQAVSKDKRESNRKWKIIFAVFISSFW